MAEYIEREELIEAGMAIKLKDICPDYNVPIVAKALEQQGQTFLKLVKKAPTEDVEKVKHGEWIKDNNFSQIVNKYKCSLCGVEDIVLHHNYCPNCGAKMDLKEGAE